MIDPIQALRAPLAQRELALGKPSGANGSAAARAQDDATTASTHKVAQNFTSLLVGTLVREMLQSVTSESENGPFGDGPGADVYKGLAESALSESLAKNGLEALTDRVHEVIARHAVPTSPTTEGAVPAVLHAPTQDREETR
ncbi:MAG: hypothetical protein IT459_11400 [Planctomycetes bacterium]|nr:hypothetical protein [Planctomycetota bacterium]